ncbi:ureidoacrylate peracid hydrolase [Pullulanibacillus pueri]|uniref:Peroxyureidoacrylate/ureidoacrylate amidohydrolase RutB n=1 Tax=Pullulanibacillus pueri TaxID=1437324 RepID=A0A8J3ELV3_9BACL|nr:isochorismatase family cysteine hydrolase [Pullulanibacillus pueri]MBM7682622.1 ureidoacrylate peracid hydrolase [Pullulanibacillus pueri]GGH82545.1 peroxyureidoacrylate/ureidoacrylate amidohydrolase RutB [Pullulanibacillus pueri]
MKAHLNPEEAALILVDIQNDFCHEAGACANRGSDVTDAQAIIPQVQKLITEARKMNVPVIFIQMTLDENTVSEAWKTRLSLQKPSQDPLGIVKKYSWGTEFYKLEPQAEDIIVEKHRYSAFIGTDLNMILQNLKRKSIIMTGVATNVCVESTARDGFMLDYNVTLVKDASACYSRELHDSTIMNIENTFGLALDTDDIINYWSKTLTMNV